jgi:hypothetical protein
LTADKVLAGTWNGKTWTMQKVVTPADPLVLVQDLSCVSAKSCAFAGVAENASGSSAFGFLEVWNGKTWTEVKWTAAKSDPDAAVFGVSCVSSSDCIVVGGEGTSKSSAAAALSWNGKKLTALKVPAPAKGGSSDLEGVSCLKANDCVAIGEVGKTSATKTTPLAGYWHGKAWTLAAA